MMQKAFFLALCAFLTACVHNNIDAGQTLSASDDDPLRSLLLFVECRDPDFGRRIETIVAEELKGAANKVELGSAHLPADASVGAVFSKTEELGIDGAFIVAIEDGGVDVNRNPMPGYVNGVAVYKPKTTSRLYANSSARLFDVRKKGTYTKIWQARAASNAGPLFGHRSTGDVSEDGVRDMVSKLRHDGLIAAGSE